MSADLTRAASLVARMTGDRMTTGVWLSSPDQLAVEILIDSGADWAVIDLEHGLLGDTDLPRVLALFRGSTCSPIVRVASNDATAIGHALDLGADGVVVPHVSTVEDARRALAATRYPPEGNRGWGAKRATGYGRQRGEYARAANGSLAVLIQLEDPDAIGRAAAISAVDGVTGVLVGPADLATSMGHVTEPDHEQVTAAIARAVAAAKTSGVAVGVVWAGERSQLRTAIEMGCTLLTVAIHEYVLRSAIDRQVALAAEVVAETASTASGPPTPRPV